MILIIIIIKNDIYLLMGHSEVFEKYAYEKGQEKIKFVIEKKVTILS